jgi:hypothetical protein
MAIAGFKLKIFDDAKALQIFVSTGAVTTVVSIVTDASGKYLLFYT